MTITEAATALGVSPALVRRYVRQGRLPAERVGARMLLIRRAAVDTFKLAARPRGRPRKVEDPAAPPPARRPRGRPRKQSPADQP